MGIVGTVPFSSSAVIVPRIIPCTPSIIPDIPKAGIIALDLYRSEDHIAFHKRCICALNNIRKSSILVVFQPPVCHGKDQVWGRC